MQEQCRGDEGEVVCGVEALEAAGAGGQVSVSQVGNPINMAKLAQGNVNAGGCCSF